MSSSELVPLSELCGYENCCFAKKSLEDDTDYGPCGDSDRFNKFGGKYFLDELKSSDEIKDDLMKQFKFKKLDVDINELQLICNRAGTKVSVIQEYGPLICYKHRTSYGLLWRVPKSCGFPGEQCKMKGLRTASVAVTVELWKIFGMPKFPLGAGLCSKHRSQKNWIAWECGTEKEEIDQMDPDFGEGTSGSFLIAKTR